MGADPGRGRGGVRGRDCYWPAPIPSHGPQKAKQLLAEAGYPNGCDAGAYYCDASYAKLGEAAVNYLRRSAYGPSWSGRRSSSRTARRSSRNIIQTASGAFGNGATRLDAFVAAGGTFTYGSYPDIEGLIREQASELDGKRREAILHRIKHPLKHGALP